MDSFDDPFDDNLDEVLMNIELRKNEELTSKQLDIECLSHLTICEVLNLGTASLKAYLDYWEEMFNYNNDKEFGNTFLMANSKVFVLKAILVFIIYFFLYRLNNGLI